MTDENDEIALTEIEPAKMTFLFQLSSKECHQVLTGRCSLEIKPADRTSYRGNADGDHCPRMFEWMNGHGSPERAPFKYQTGRSPITLGQHRCGHYSINDGQHRTCIAQKKGLKVLAEVVPDEMACELCYGKSFSPDNVLR